MKHYIVIAHEEVKEEGIYSYKGNYTIKELETLAIEEIRDNTSMEYENIEDCYIHIDFIFESDSPIEYKSDSFIK